MTQYCIEFTDVGNEVLPISKGTVQKMHLDAGLSMRVWNLNFSQMVTLTKSAEPIHSQFYLLFILTPDPISLKSIEQHLQYNTHRERHALLIPDNVAVQFTVLPNEPVRIIEFNISVWWLKLLLADRQTEALYDPLWSDPDHKTVYIETGSWQMNAIAGELFKQTHAGCAEPAVILPACMSLIAAFMQKKFSARRKDVRVRDVYHDKMEEAEAILMGHLRNTLPNLFQIARQLAISESTLKRHFKLVYGKSIYGYYLDKKMELAKQLLEETHPSVNEMAEMLGYEKVSYFIEIFKKHHGFSPGEILKSRNSA